MKPLIKTASGAILYSSYSLLNLLFYKKKNKIVFISFPDAADNSWHLYKYALANLKGYEIFWLVNDDSEAIRNKILSYRNNFSDNNNKITVLKRWSIKGLVAFSSARFVFHTHGTYYFIKKSFNAPIIVNLWHGMPIKSIGLLDNTNNKNFCYSDYSIATSDSYRKIISDAFNVPFERVLSTGLPRNDILVEGVSAKIKKNILASLNIDFQDKLIVWLPTYRISNIGDIRTDSNSNSFLDDLKDNFLDELNSLCSENNIKVIIKLHPMDSLSSKASDFNFSNITFYDSTTWQLLNIDIYELLSISLGIVSDFSSVMIDCIATKISVGYIASSKENYTRKTVVPIEDIFDHVTIIKEPIDFIHMCENKRNNVSNDINSNKFNNFGFKASEKILKVLNIF